jgi:hypothetical protein
MEDKNIMGQSIEYRKQMTEIVHINLPGPQEPQAGMSGGELLHGFLAELKRTPNHAASNYIQDLCVKWNIHYRQTR